MRIKTSLAAMVAALAMLLWAALGYAQDFNALRNTQGAGGCTALGPVASPPSCLSWVELAQCLTVAANTQPGSTCTNLSSAAVQALASAGTACGTQGSQNAGMTAEIASLRARLQGCESRPAAPTVAPARPRLLRIPVCLSAPQFGNARTRVVLRSGETCVVRMNHARRVLDVIQGGAACAQISRSEVASADCVCRPGAQAVLRQGGGYVCALIIGTETLMPSGDADSGLTARVNRLQTTINEISDRFDRMCAHDVTTVGADGASSVTRSVECPALGQLLMQRILEASDEANPLNTAGLEGRLRRLEENDRRQDRLLADHDQRITRLERSWGWRFFAGGEAGLGVMQGMTLINGHVGFQGRARVAGPFSFQASVGALYGQYDAPMMPMTVGYMATLGIGFVFETGRVRHAIDIGASVRSYADTGYHPVPNPSAGFLAGDFLGRTFGVEGSYLAMFHGFGVQPTVFVGYGESVWGAVVTRGNRRVFVSGTTTGVTALFGLRFSYGN